MNNTPKFWYLTWQMSALKVLRAGTAAQQQRERQAAFLQAAEEAVAGALKGLRIPCRAVYAQVTRHSAGALTWCQDLSVAATSAEAAQHGYFDMPMAWHMGFTLSRSCFSQ